MFTAIKLARTADARATSGEEAQGRGRGSRRVLAPKSDKKQEHRSQKKKHFNPASAENCVLFVVQAAKTKTEVSAGIPCFNKFFTKIGRTPWDEMNDEVCGGLFRST